MCVCSDGWCVFVCVCVCVTSSELVWGIVRVYVNVCALYYTCLWFVSDYVCVNACVSVCVCKCICVGVGVV